MRGTVAVAAVRAAFGLKCRLMRHKRRSEAAKHLFDDVVRPYAKSLPPDLGRHMSVAEMPRESYEVTGTGVCDVDDGLSRRTHHEPRPVIEL